MNWYCAKTSGPEVRALFHLKRAGVEAYSPVIHRYFIDRRTQREKMRILRLFPGYVFIRLGSLAEREAATTATGVAYLLGSWMDGAFTPRKMPSVWLEALMSAGPVIEGKRLPFQKGKKVRLAANRLRTTIIEAEVQSVDKSGRVEIDVELFGRSHRVKVAPELLEPVAETV